MKLGLVMVLTPDLHEARTFYGDLLELPLKAEGQRELVFDMGGQALHVFRCEAPAPASARHGATAATVVVFEVASIEDRMRELRRRGVEFLHETPARNDLGGFLYAAFRAPGGNVHELIERN
ncbi:MAG: VOC family protein [Caulobacteraceae bacterium]